MVGTTERILEYRTIGSVRTETRRNQLIVRDVARYCTYEDSITGYVSTSFITHNVDFLGFTKHKLYSSGCLTTRYLFFVWLIS